MSNLEIDERLGLPLALALFVWVMGQMLFPASYWFDVGQINVHDAPYSRLAEVDYPRTIRRDFDGVWYVKIRARRDDGWETICVSPDRRERYSTDSVLPEPVTLEWFAWTEPRCYTLPPGEYELRVEWVTNPGSLLRERRVVREDTFIIWEGANDPDA